ncbi:hypothetical protein [Staphylococcus aureus]|uniref:hypothetical protein n=1 Tax=Staphylococcus aureus TaxID=1280 RepID=UPI0020A05488|nr:hypothetical protein [Staphylococcus aureus]
MYLGHVKVLLGMFLSLKTLYRKRTVIWPFYFYTIIRTLSKYKLLTEEEYEKKLVKTNELEYTVLDLLISANFNLNKFNTGNLDEDNKSDSIGKHQLSMAVEFISKGLDLSSPIEFYK